MGSPGSHSKPPLPKTRERTTIRANQEGGGTHASSRSSPHASRARHPPAVSRGSQRSSLQRGMIWVGALALCSFCLLETWRRVSFLLSPAAILSFDKQLLPLVVDPNHLALIRTSFVLPEKREKQRKDGGQEPIGGFAARSVHWVSLAEGQRPGDLVAAFVGGTWEGKPDTAIYVADYDRQTNAWSEPRVVASAAGHNTRPGARPGAVWYPVLCRLPIGPSSGPGRGKEGGATGGRLLLMYKVGTPVDWTGFQAVSLDGGNSWATPAPMNFTGAPGYGPFHACVNVPSEPADEGRRDQRPMVLMGSRSMTNTGVGVHLELSNDNGETWNRTTSIPFEGGSISNPSLFLDGSGGVRMLAQHRAAHPSHSRAVMAVSDRSGLRWGPAREVDLPNMDSPLDAIRLTDGRVLAVYNHVNRSGLGGRKLLNVGLSYDEGETWGVVMTLEFDEKRIGREFSNPAVVQTSDGLVHVCYVHSLVRTAPGPMTGRENLKHVTLDPKHLDEGYFSWLRDNMKWPLPHDAAAIDKGTRSSGATELQILEKDAAAGIKIAVTIRHRIEANRRANAEAKAPRPVVQSRPQPSTARGRREARRRSAEETDAMARGAAEAAAAEVEALLGKDPADAGEESVPRVALTESRLETLDVIHDYDVVEFDHGQTSAGTEGYAIDERAGPPSNGPKTRARRQRRRQRQSR